jgi:parallel beta-helix repeat protein
LPLKNVFAIMLVLLTASMLALAFKIQPVKASGTIYIRPDGSVDPPTAPIQRYFGVYTFIDNIFDEEIVVQKSDIIIDGTSALLQGSGSGIGFSLVDVNNITIKNVIIRNYTYGLRLGNSSHNTIIGNSIENNVTYTSYGIWLSRSSYNNISGNMITNNSQFGIYLEYSDYNNISGNNIKNNHDGLRLGFSNLNSLHSNIVTNNVYGGYLAECYNNTISENNMTDNVSGLYIGWSSYNIIYENTIADNDWSGVWVRASSDNRFYHNNIVNNSVHNAYIDEGENVWDDYAEGNYWSDYAGTDANHDGIGEATYVIDGNNIDNYPLMGSFHSFNTSLGYRVNVISNSTIEDFEYFNSNSTIKMYVSNSSATQSFGFCRVSIPKSLIAPPYTVIIDDGLSEILYFNGTIYDNGTQRWIYFAYEHSTHTVEIIPEFPMPLILVMLLLTTSLAVIVLRKIKRVANFIL